MTHTAPPDIGTATQVCHVFIRATPQKIWDAITKPEWTQRFGYGLRDQFELRPGGKYRGCSNEGMLAMNAPEVAVDGRRPAGHRDGRGWLWILSDLKSLLECGEPMSTRKSW